MYNFERHGYKFHVASNSENQIPRKSSNLGGTCVWLFTALWLNRCPELHLTNRLIPKSFSARCAPGQGSHRRGLWSILFGLIDLVGLQFCISKQDLVEHITSTRIHSEKGVFEADDQFQRSHQAHLSQCVSACRLCRSSCRDRCILDPDGFPSIQGNCRSSLNSLACLEDSRMGSMRNSHPPRTVLDS